MEASAINRAIFFSFLLHVVVGASLLVWSPNAYREVPSLSQTVTMVSLVAPKPPQRQIISPPQNIDSPPPKEARYESDKDVSTPKEQIRRGEANAGRINPASPPPRKPAEPAPPKRETQPENPNPVIKSLRLNSGELLSSVQAAEKRQLDEEKKQLANLAGSAPGNFGSNDHLPNVADGDITMLNAKANQYAVFVRRVAQQVFGGIKSGGYLGISIKELQNSENPVRFRAILSPKGDLLRVERVYASGGAAFDQVVEKAIQRGASDPNPPKNAALPDGTYSFLFQAEAKGWIDQNPRTGLAQERRWLLLSTGLE